MYRVRFICKGPAIANAISKAFIDQEVTSRSMRCAKPVRRNSDNIWRHKIRNIVNST